MFENAFAAVAGGNLCFDHMAVAVTLAKRDTL